MVIYKVFSFRRWSPIRSDRYERVDCNSLEFLVKTNRKTVRTIFYYYFKVSQTFLSASVARGKQGENVFI